VSRRKRRKMNRIVENECNDYKIYITDLTEYYNVARFSVLLTSRAGHMCVSISSCILVDRYMIFLTVDLEQFKIETPPSPLSGRSTLV
jgi:hypothetical protein